MGKLTKKQFHAILVTLSFLYIINSHLFLPIFNDGKPVLFFTTWNLFGSGPAKVVKDISWDGGKSFLLKDYDFMSLLDQEYKVPFFHSIDHKNTDALKKNYLLKIKKFCKCKNVELITLSGSFYQHYILKEDLEILERVEL